MARDLPFNDNVGDTIPADTPHAVSVSLPTWRANVAYEEAEPWVVARMKTGYPRFFVHKSVDRLACAIAARHGGPETTAMLFPFPPAAQRCVDFLRPGLEPLQADAIRLVRFVPANPGGADQEWVLPHLSAVVFPKALWPRAKTFWQHTGEGVSSRRAESCERALTDGTMLDSRTADERSLLKKGPRRYQRQVTVNGHDEGKTQNGRHDSKTDGHADTQDSTTFVEERYGRNLSLTLAKQAKLAVRRRIAGSLSNDMDLNDALAQPEDLDKIRTHHGFSVDDIYLYANGMNSIFSAHRTMLLARGPMKSIMFGFPYVDTLKILQKWGPGVQFYGHGSSEDLDDLEARLHAGERYLALFCEFPGNPLLKSPDLKRIRRLADQYDFAVVVDETIGNFLNVHVLPDADVVVSSLTKIFSGDSNVMGGSAILNPSGAYYSQLKRVLATEYDDTLFEEDAVFLERNSRDFVTRIARINRNAEIICDVLAAHPRVKTVNYPKVSPSKAHYDAYKLPGGGYGGLLSCIFHSIADAEAFYDNLESAKGPSLGTNFTLASPFVILAHYTELEWAAQYGCEASLVRFSVGLEDEAVLRERFERALAAVPA